jgi:hypothetical protein
MAVTVALGMQTGCTTTAPDLPTISGSAKTLPTMEDLTKTAQRQYDCLLEAGLEPNFSFPYGMDGHQTRVEVGGKSYVMERVEQGKAQMISGGEPWSAADQKLIDAFMSDKTSTDYALIVDGTDRTQIMLECRAQTGYDPAIINQVDPETLPRDEVLKQVDSNNQCAACARQNGWPSVKDIAMPDDLTELTMPTVKLPFSIEPMQLEALLAVCPNFNRDLADSYGPGGAEPEDYPPDPNIDFDPPFSIWPADPDKGPTAEEQPIIDKSTKLLEVLHREFSTYSDEQCQKDPECRHMSIGGS